MRMSRSTSLVAALVLWSALPLRAQTALEPSGHWDGRIEAPGFEKTFTVDVAKNDTGGFAGTLSIPAEHLNGLPIRITVTGKLVHFVAREDQPFNAYLSEDGKSMSGDFSVEGFSIPLTMTRTGDARVDTPERSATIGKELEGHWIATVPVESTSMRLVLTIANDPDGTSSGSMINLDQGKLEIPVSAITQSASSVSLDFKAVGASFAGTLDAGATELAGTYQERGRAMPLTFRRAPENK